MLKLAKRMWVLLVILLVVVIAAFCVDRFRGFFGQTELTRPGAGLVNDPEPFNPKEVKYEIFGTGTVATINYLDLDAQPQKAVERPVAVDADPDHDRSRRQPEHRRAERRRQHHLPDHRRRRGQGREDHRRRERPDLLLGEVRMSNTHVGAHPMIPRFIRLFSVPILLGWLALDRHRERHRPSAGKGRRGARGVVGPQRRTVAAGDATHR